MDFSYPLDPEIYIIPSGYEWQSIIDTKKTINKYKFIGTGQNIGGIAFADGMNEFGLGVATLYFQGYAHFKEVIGDKLPIASYDIVNYLLGNCSNIDDVINTIHNIDIIGVEDALTRSVSPLHWIVMDKNKCIVIEITENGLQIFDNPINVLTNSPNFTWQITNLRNYLNLNSEQLENKKWDNLILSPFGQGGGSFGLPGDFTSPSRFVRASFIKNNIVIPEDDFELANTGFHILKSVFIPKGVVITNKNKSDYTQYTVFMNLNTLDYYINTYDCSEITNVNLKDYNPSDIISLGKINYKDYSS